CISPGDKKKRRPFSLYLSNQPLSYSASAVAFEWGTPPADAEKIDIRNKKWSLLELTKDGKTSKLTSTLQTGEKLTLKRKKFVKSDPNSYGDSYEDSLNQELSLELVGKDGSTFCQGEIKDLPGVKTWVHSLCEHSEGNGIRQENDYYRISLFLSEPAPANKKRI